MPVRTKIAFFILLVTALNMSGQEKSKFHHVLLYQWNDATEVKEKQEFLNLFKALPQRIEGVESVLVSNVHGSSENYDVLIDIVFSNRSNLKNYQTHKDHDLIVLKASELVQSYAYVQHSE